MGICACWLVETRNFVTRPRPGRSPCRPGLATDYVRIRDDRDEIAQLLPRYGDANGDGWADAFRQLYERGGKDALLDSLHDLEVDPLMRGWLVEYMKLELGEPRMR